MTNLAAARTGYKDAKADLEFGEDTRALADAYEAAVAYIEALEKAASDASWQQEFTERMRQRWR